MTSFKMLLSKRWLLQEALLIQGRRSLAILTRTYTPGVTTEVQDSNGKVVTCRYDDQNIEIVVEALFAGATLPSRGELFNYAGNSYEATSIELRGANNEFRRVVLTGRNTEYA
jgi:hypothetical protein